MGFVEIENAGKRALEQFPFIKRSVKRAYQLISVAISGEHFKSEGDMVRVSPDDNYEYFYGYYDKSPWDATDRYMISVKVRQTYKSVAPKEPGIVCLIDTQKGNKIYKIGTTYAWNVQQSCMAQWIGPDFKTRIIYNDFRDGRYCAVIYSLIEKKEIKVLPMAVYEVSRDGSFALSLDFNRLHRMRPGYGYSNLPEVTKGELCPDMPCIWKMDLESGEVTKLFKYTDFAAFEPDETMEGAEHKVNHLMISPNGKRFMVLHRWFQNGHKHTRLVTVNIDRTEMYNLSDDVFVSHSCWKNNDEILSFLRKRAAGEHYYLMKDKTQEYKMYWPELNTDGHCSYSPDGRNIITDTYPNRKRIASLYFCTEEDDKSRRIARVFSPFKYDNDCRCDLHPRWNRKGDKICIDSVHEGKRGLYIISVESILQKIKLEKETYKQNSEIRISFVIPAYNAEKTIGRCLDSLMRQTMTDWEAIVVDDGSTDRTLKVIEQYKEDSRIIVITQENSGSGNARNNGIRFAKGDFISFLDSDDYLDDRFVELIGERINNTNADIVFYETHYEDENGKVIKTSKIYVHAEKSKNDFITAQMSGTFSWGADKVIRRALILSSKAQFMEQEVGEEALFTFQILKESNRIEFVKTPLYHYIQSEQGQHKKGQNDPLNGAVYSVKKYMEKNSLLPEYQPALINMAYKAVLMSLYRTALSYPFYQARKIMTDRLAEYEKEFDFNLVDYTMLNQSARFLLPFVQNRMVTLIYMISKLKKLI